MSLFSEWVGKQWGSVLTRNGRKRRQSTRRRPDTSIVRIEGLEDRVLLSADFGDAPDDGVPGNGPGDYTTLLSADGPRHTVDTAIFMGGNVDMEADAIVNAAANGDDIDQALPDDEDGLVDPLTDLQLTVGTQPRVRVTVTNTTGDSATLSGWIDYDGDGVFDNATERAQVVVADGTDHGVVTLVFPTVPQGTAGTTYARFRLSTDVAAEESTGAAADGEVEDYAASITSPSDAAVVDFTKIAHQTNGGPTITDIQTQFGESVTALGDLNNDGVTDLAVGVYRDDVGGSYRGAVYVLFMNADGTVASTVKIDDDTPNGPQLIDRDRFGTSIANLGDINGDGVTDIAVGAVEGDDFHGSVFVLFLNADGSVKQTRKIGINSPDGASYLNDFSRFGNSIATIGDLDGDGVTEIAVGAPSDRTIETGAITGNHRGAVVILYLNSDGSVKKTARIDDSTPGGPVLVDADMFGTAIAGLGDLDGDGISDIAVGVEENSVGVSRAGRAEPGRGRLVGRVQIFFLNANGSIKSSTIIDDTTTNGPMLDDDAYFGFSLANVGDLNGDGVIDLAVGEARGPLRILQLNTDGSVKATTVVTDIRTGNSFGSPSDWFGSSIANLGDLDGDGAINIAAGAPQDGTGGDRFGAVYIVNLYSGELDFGDAPNVYGTSDASNGPRHLISSDLFLGGRVDGEDDATPNDAANGDDVDQALPDDEDGVVDPLTDLQFVVGTQPGIRVTATNTTGDVARITGWIDYNGDGFFDTTHESVLVVVPDGSVNEVFTLVFPQVPDGAVSETYARLRLTTDISGLNPTGFADDGEVEDYIVSITHPSLGDVKSITKIAHETSGGPSLGDALKGFGASVTSVGDLNNDGVSDLAVGVPHDDTGGQDRGAVYILFMNADGTVDSTVKIDDDTANGPELSDRDLFGLSVTRLGDLDGDGVTDIAVGAIGSPQSFGAVHIVFLNPDGSVKNTTRLDRNSPGGLSLINMGAEFGRSVTALGDLDGDGVTEIAVGASNDLTDENGGATGNARGSVFIVFLNADGTAKKAVKIDDSTPGGPVLANLDRFGYDVTGIGDLNGDGIGDLAVGTPEGGLNGQHGRVHILYLNSEGGIVGGTTIDENDVPGVDYFGASVANLGDLDGDGVTDLAIGAYDSSYGEVRIVLLNADGTVKGSRQISRNSIGGPQVSFGDNFGVAIANLGDLDGDGTIDLAVGAPNDDTGGQGFGAVYIINLELADYDFGDAPVSYPVTLSQNGARHKAVGPTLGPNRDTELEGRPSDNATGDDHDFRPDDEFGVEFIPGTLVASGPGSTGRVRVNLQNPDAVSNRLDAYVDFNQNGIWEPGEKVFDNFDLGTTAGFQVLAFAIPEGTLPGTTFSRFRISTTGGLGVDGVAADGEVEDHVVTFEARAPLPAALTGPVGQVGDPSVTLAWNESQYASAYELKVYNVDLGREIVNQILPGQTSFTVPGPLTANTTYSAYVRGVNDAGVSTWSRIEFRQNPVDSDVTVPVLTGPIENIDDSTATITWAEFPGASNYTVILYSVTRGQELVRQNVGSATQFETPELPAGERFQVFVQAELTDTSQVLSAPLYFNLIDTDPQLLPAPVVTQYPATVRDLSPQIEFEAIPGAVDYEAYLYDQAAGVLVMPPTHTGGETFLQISQLDGLQRGRTYEIYVRGYTADGEAGLFGKSQFITAHDAQNFVPRVIDFESLAHDGAGVDVHTRFDSGSIRFEVPSNPSAGFGVFGSMHPAYAGSAAFATFDTEQVVEMSARFFPNFGPLFDLHSLDLAEFGVDGQYSPATEIAGDADEFGMRHVIHFPNRKDLPPESLRNAAWLYDRLGCRAMVIHRPMFQRYSRELLELNGSLKLGVENHRLDPGEFLEWAGQNEWLTLDVEHLWKFTLNDAPLDELLAAVESFLARFADKLVHVHLPGYVPGFDEHRPMYCSREMVTAVFTLLDEAGFTGLVVSEVNAEFQNPCDLRMDVLLEMRWQQLRKAAENPAVSV
eukprot:g21913.t1